MEQNTNSSGAQGTSNFTIVRHCEMRRSFGIFDNKIYIQEIRDEHRRRISFHTHQLNRFANLISGPREVLGVQIDPAGLRTLQNVQVCFGDGIAHVALHCGRSAYEDTK